jgi:hypothetical protein
VEFTPEESWSIQHLRVGRIADADPASYRALSPGCARDARRAYAEGRPFAARDVATFESLAADFARDAQRGYHARIEIPGSHRPSGSGTQLRRFDGFVELCAHARGTPFSKSAR